MIFPMSLLSTSTSDGASVTSNRGTFTIVGPIDQLVIKSGISNNNGGNVTIGLTTFLGDLIDTSDIIETRTVTESMII